MADVANQGELISGSWNDRLQACRAVQDRYINVDPAASGEVHAMLAAAGLSSGLPGDYEVSLGFERRPLSVSVTRRVISLTVPLKGLRPGRDRAKLTGLLELNGQADIAKVGLGGDGDLILLFEVPQVLPDLAERATSEFARLYAGVRDIVGTG